MTDLIGESVLLEKDEYDKLKLKAELGECLLHYLLRRHSDDLWSKEHTGHHGGVRHGVLERDHRVEH